MNLPMTCPLKSFLLNPCSKKAWLWYPGTNGVAFTKRFISGTSGPGKKNLLITFDAFDTLYTPSTSVAQQYLSAGKRHGIDVSHITEEDMDASVKRAVQRQRQRSPNYSVSGGDLADEQVQAWWGEVIRETWRPFLSSNQQTSVNDGMIQDLFDRFRGKAGYMLYPDVEQMFSYLRRHRSHAGPQTRGNSPWDKIMVGVITNSDGRVRGILKDLGIDVQLEPGLDFKKDVDFLVVSADVGHEKPDPSIWRAAEEDVDKILREQSEREASTRGENRESKRITNKLDSSMFEFKVHVGDSLEKDHDGALAAGWKGILLDRDCSFSSDVGIDESEFKSIARKDRKPGQSEYVTMMRSLKALETLKPDDLDSASRSW